jgi:phosphoribosyl-AMP cyclohydrolase
MKEYRLILPVEDQYLRTLSQYPEGKTIFGEPKDEKFMWVFDTFFQKGIQDFIVIGEDLWPLIPKVKAKYGISVIAGGKIDSLEKANEALSIGADQVVVASYFYNNPDSIKQFAKVLGNKLVCSVDRRSNFIEGTSIPVQNFIEKAKSAGIENFMFVNGDLRSSLRGVNLNLISDLTKLFKTKFIYSGGVSSQHDVNNLVNAGIKKIVSGSALYSGKLEPEGIDFKKGKGLIPTIIQDAKSYTVLMLGYMNQEAFSKTCSTEFVHFWSRSRKKLWMKGEESGNKLKVEKIFIDCDKDTILIKAELLGKTVCHTGKYSCFSENDII